MNKKIVILILPVLLILSTQACGRSIISGRIVDAETEQPIKGAAIYVLWTKQELWPPGLAEEVRYEQSETLTDSESRFKIPK